MTSETPIQHEERGSHPMQKTISAQCEVEPSMRMRDSSDVKTNFTLQLPEQQSIHSMHSTKISTWETSNQACLDPLYSKHRGQRRELHKQQHKRRERKQRREQQDAIQDKKHSPRIETNNITPRKPKRIKSRNVERERREQARDHATEISNAILDTKRKRRSPSPECIIQVNKDNTIEVNEVIKPKNRWYAKCSTPGCPCEASFNGQDNEACGRGCRIHGPCKTNQHYFPREIPEEDALRQPGSHPITKRRDTIRLTKDAHDKATSHPKHYTPSKSKRKSDTRK